MRIHNRIRHSNKKIPYILLALCTIASTLTFSFVRVQAAEATENFGDFQVTYRTDKSPTFTTDDVLQLPEGGEYTVKMKNGIDSTSQNIELLSSNITDATKLTLDSVNIKSSESALHIPTNVDVLLNILGENSLVSTGGAGIQKDGGDGKLSINGTGSLHAKGGGTSAGIGSIENSDTSNISIVGGTIKAEGGLSSAGIGAGFHSKAYNISISGGDVTAVGGNTNNDYLYAGSGIGALFSENCDKIIITGGNITASGGEGYKDAGQDVLPGVGILGTNITITSGTISSTKNTGIKGSDISIEGGDISVESDGYDLGGKIKGTDVSISGGTIKANQIEATYNHLIFSGGSINATTSVPPLDHNGKQVYKTEIMLFKEADVAANIEFHTITDVTYGTKGMKSNADGYLYLWLPEGTRLSNLLDIANERYDHGLPDPFVVKPTHDNSTIFGLSNKYQIQTRVEGGDGRLVVFSYGGSPGGVYDKEKGVYLKPYADSLPEGSPGTQYKVVVCIPDGYTLKSVTLNDENIMKGNAIYEFGPGLIYGGPVYTFTMPEEDAQIVATLEENRTGTLLATPTNVKWDANTGKATWDKVDNAKYYLLQLYKDGEKLSLDTFNDASFDYSYMAGFYGPGDYSFSVKAIGDGNNYRNSEWSGQSGKKTLTKGFEVTGTEGGYTYSKLNKMLTISQPGDYTVRMEEGATVTDHRIDITAKEGTVNLTLDNVNIEAEKQNIWFSNDSPIDAVITLKGDNRLISTSSTAIQKSGTSLDLCGTLTFREHADGGSLYVKGKEHGIGGKKDNNYESELYHVNFESGDIAVVGGLQAIGSYYTNAHKDTAGNVDVNIKPEPNQIASLYLGPDESSATLWEQPFTSEDKASLGYTFPDKYTRIRIIPPTISANITWGSMEFTFDEATKTWTPSTETSDQITVKNNGNIPFYTKLNYIPQITNVTGTFNDGKNPIAGISELVPEETKEFHLNLNGNPNFSWEGLSTIGGITVTLSSSLGYQSKKKVSLGVDYAVVLTEQGSAMSWGWNSLGQLGDETVSNHNVPVYVKVPENITFTSVSAGYQHTAALDSDGNAWAWGWGNHGQLGNEQSGFDIYESTPVQVNMPEDIKFASISAGGNSTFAFDTDGNLWAWGNNGNGKLGIGTIKNSNIPVKVEVPDHIKFTSISSNLYHTVALDSNGNAWAWGWNDSGQLGIENISQSTVPLKIQMPQGVWFTEIMAGQDYTVALDSNGNAWTWGWNAYGQLGNGNNDDSSTPIQVNMPKNIKFSKIAAGNYHVIALDTTGHAWAWGLGSNGQLGNKNSDDSNIPVPVDMPENKVFTQVYAGWSFSATIDGDGNLWTWGSNNKGNLGVGSDADSNIPVKVSLSDGNRVAQVIDQKETQKVLATYQPAGDIYQVDVTWGAMEFTYEEANKGTWDSFAHEYQNASAAGWKCDIEDGNLITVKNNGNMDVSVTPTYEADSSYSGVSGTFSDGTNLVTSISLPAGQEGKVWLDLTGTPSNVWSDKLKIGTVKITIGGGNQ